MEDHFKLHWLERRKILLQTNHCLFFYFVKNNEIFLLQWRWQFWTGLMTLGTIWLWAHDTWKRRKKYNFKHYWYHIRGATEGRLTKFVPPPPPGKKGSRKKDNCVERTTFIQGEGKLQDSKLKLGGGEYWYLAHLVSCYYVSVWAHLILARGDSCLTLGKYLLKGWWDDLWLVNLNFTGPYWTQTVPEQICKSIH
jgi:hypothetical protein